MPGVSDEIGLELAGMTLTRHRAAHTLIAGRHHPLVKRIRAMVRSGVLLSAGEVLLETPRLIEDAIRSGVPITTLLVARNIPPSLHPLLRRVPATARRYELEPKLLPELSSTENNPGVLAMFKAPHWNEADLFTTRRPLLVILAGIQDPGNLGAVLRSAEAFGASGVLATKGTVSPYNAKALRAASGTIFRLPLLQEMSNSEITSLLRRKKVTILASASRGGASLGTVDVIKPLALALGSEGAGLPRELAAAGKCVSIPIASHVESLNVAAAAAVMLHEIARRRNLQGNRREEK